MWLPKQGLNLLSTALTRHLTVKGPVSTSEADLTEKNQSSQTLQVIKVRNKDFYLLNICSQELLLTIQCTLESAAVLPP